MHRFTLLKLFHFPAVLKYIHACAGEISHVLENGAKANAKKEGEGEKILGK